MSKTIRPDGQEHSVLSYGSGHVYGVAFNKQELVAFQRDDLHRETTRMLANGLMQSNVYNDVGLLSSQRIFAEDQPEQHYQASRTYHYDKNYLLTQVDDSRLGRLNYQYDPIGRLIKSQSAHLTESFDFDPAGNLIDATHSQASAVKNNLIKTYQGKSYKYDAQGNVIETQHAGQQLKLTWDNLNRLSRSDLNGKVTDYAYDVFGRRIYKKSQATGTTLFGWDGDLMVWEFVKAADETQNYTKHYIYEPNSFVPMVQAGYGSFIKLLDTPDYSQFKEQPYSMQRDPVWKTDSRYKRAEIERAVFYHCDQVGTPQTLSNEKGELIWDAIFNTWGQAIEIKASDNLLEQTNIRFQGQYYDIETGLHYNRYRYYEPHSARYIGKDPIGLEGGMNTSAYVSDPNGWIDALGLNSNFAYGGQIIGLSQQASSNLEYEAYSNYDCWMKTGNICRVQKPPLFDYVYCSGGIGPLAYSRITNLHNGKVFIAGASSQPDAKGAKTIGKNAIMILDGSKKIGAANFSTLKGQFSASCMAGYIMNKPEQMSKSESTDSFLTGLSASASHGIRGVRVGVVLPIDTDRTKSPSQKVKDYFSSNTMKGLEVGLGIPGKDFNFGYGVEAQGRTIE